MRFLARLVGWLLTPVVAWAASYAGATITAAVLSGAARPQTALLVAFVMGLVSSVVATLIWLRMIRRSRQIQQTLQVTEAGTPAALEATEPPAAAP